MARKDAEPKVDRRNFLTGVAVAGAAAVAGPPDVATAVVGTSEPAAKPSAARPTAVMAPEKVTVSLPSHPTVRAYCSAGDNCQ